MTAPTIQNPTPKTPALVAALGASLSTFPCPETVAVQLAPQTKPDGQHPPPTLAPHVCQPVLQVPEGAAAALDAGVPAMIVRLLVVTTPTVADGGQEVVSQFRPTRQQPPM